MHHHFDQCREPDLHNSYVTCHSAQLCQEIEYVKGNVESMSDFAESRVHKEKTMSPHKDIVSKLHRECMPAAHHPNANLLIKPSHNP